MTDDRKYRDDEIKEIFDLAASSPEAGAPAVRDGAGLTLAELQDVGLEVGMAPERIAEAAMALDARAGTVPRGTYLGMPRSVGRIVDLPRNLTDREWAILVGHLRETFGAKGRVTSEGGLREWSNGNLHAYLEPTSSGYRLRLGTTKGNAVPLLRAGVAALVGGAAVTTLLFFEEVGRAPMVIPSLIAMAGAITAGSTLLRLPKWAQRRETQMEAIAGRVGAMLAESAKALPDGDRAEE